MTLPGAVSGHDTLAEDLPHMALFPQAQGGFNGIKDSWQHMWLPLQFPERASVKSLTCSMHEACPFSSRVIGTVPPWRKRERGHVLQGQRGGCHNLLPVPITCQLCLPLLLSIPGWHPAVPCRHVCLTFASKLMISIFKTLRAGPSYKQ